MDTLGTEHESQENDVWVDDWVIRSTALSGKHKCLYAAMCAFKKVRGQPPCPDDVDFDKIVLSFGLAKFGTLKADLKKLCEVTGMKYPAIRSFVYVATDASGLTKIGHTEGLGVWPRIRDHLVSNPSLRLLAYTKADKSEEKRLHKVYENQRVSGEWFKLSKEQLDTLVSPLTICSFRHEQHA